VADVYCALLHHPVKDRAGTTVTTAVTTLDVHDIARSALTFGLRGYFVVSPIEAQHVLIDRVLSHWRTGAGVQRMPERGEALAICRSARTLAEVCATIESETGRAPQLWPTAAAPGAGRAVTEFVDAAKRIQGATSPILILFGTGHGLADEVLDDAHLLLEPIAGVADYNHLSVRSAAAIVFDRLLGRSRSPQPDKR